MAKNVQGPKNPQLPADVRQKLEHAAEKIGKAVEAVIPHRNAVVDAYNKEYRELPRMSVEQKDAVRIEQQQLTESMRSAWDEARGKFLAESTKGQSARTWWSSSPISGVESTLKLLRSLTVLQGMPTEQAVSLLGEEAATKILTWNQLHDVMMWGQMMKADVGDIIPIEALEKLRDQLRPSIDAYRQMFRDIELLERPVSDLAPGLDERLQGKMLPDVLSAVADRIEQHPDQDWIRAFHNQYPQNRSPKVPEYAANDLRQTGASLQKDKDEGRNLGYRGSQVISAVGQRYAGEFADQLKVIMSAAKAIERGYPEALP